MADPYAWIRELRGGVRARVVDRDGTPLAGARVMARPPRGGGFVESTADAGGSVELSGLRATPDAMLWFEAPGHARVRLQHLCIHPGEPTDLGDVVLARARSVRLCVVGRDRAPIAGAKVCCDRWYWTREHSAGMEGPPTVAHTDRDGVASIDTLGRGAWRLEVRAEGHRVLEIAQPDDASGALDLGDVQLDDRPRIVRGSVRDLDDDPPPGATSSGAAVRGCVPTGRDDSSSSTGRRDHRASSSPTRISRPAFW